MRTRPARWASRSCRRWRRIRPGRRRCGRWWTKGQRKRSSPVTAALCVRSRCGWPASQQRIEADASTVEGVTMSINSAADDWPPGAVSSSAPSTPPATPTAAPGKLTGQQVQQIQDATWPAHTPDSLQEMVRTQLDQDLAAIAHGDTFHAQVFSLIDWAERQGQVADLLQGACAADPGNVALQRVWPIFRRAANQAAAAAHPLST